MSARKLRRMKEKAAKKAAKKASKKAGNQLARMPIKCGECGKEFNKDDKELWSRWRIAVYDDGPIHLACPDCVPEEIKNRSST